MTGQRVIRSRRRRARAVVFDVDGTLADSEPLAGRAWDHVLHPHGVTRTEHDDRVITGRSFEEARDHFASRAPALPTAATLWEPYSRRLLALLTTQLQPHPDALALLIDLRRRRVPIALASSSVRVRLTTTLTALGLGDLMPVSVAGDEVPAPKPAPDAYLAAADLLGLRPYECVAIEDSATGVAAAVAAGMAVIGVQREEWADLSEANVVVDRLAPTTVDPLLAVRPRPRVG